MRHPDEGQIHAWLDGALDPATADGLEAHVAACPDCAAAVAEARGLIAGASRILLALDDVPSGVIPVATGAVAVQGSDDLAALRSRQHESTTALQRRRIPWHARRSVQVAASLMLVAGIGGVVVRNSDRADEKVFIQIETDAAPATRGPAAGSTPPSITVPAPVAESGSQIATAPPAEQLRGKVTAPEMTPAPGRADAAFGGAAQSLAKARDASSRERAAEQRQASTAAAEPMAPPPPAAPAASVPLPTVGAVAAPFASAATANLSAPVLMDSAARLTRGLGDMPAMRRSLTGASGTVAGKVIGADDAPIAMATVSIPAANVATQTAADGSFTLPSLAPGRYTLEARRIGYSAARVEGLEIVAGDTAYARVAMQANANQLSQVVVTGAGAGSASLAGACFILTASPPASDRGIPILPRRIRFQLAELPVSADAAESAGARSQAAPLRLSRTETAAAGEPSAPMSWQPKPGNSVDVFWPINGDVVTLSLEIRGSTVTGTALTVSHPIRSAGLEGRRVDCSSR